MNDKYSHSQRNINSLLDYDSDEIVFDDSREDKYDKHNKESHKNNNKHDRDRKNVDVDELFGKKKHNKEKVNNPVYKLIMNESYYSKKDAYNELVDHDGLYLMIKDLKNWSKNPKNKKPIYIQTCLRDIVVAAALPEAIKTVLKDNSYNMERKDFDYLMDEIFIFVRSSNDDQRLNSKYSKEAIEAMREAYTSILYKFNKKKLKKLNELNIDEDIAKKILILTAGKNANSSIYALLKFFYRNSKRMEISEKLLCKIFKVCYGKENMTTVVKCIMNEKVNPMQNNTNNNGPFSIVQDNPSEVSMYVLIDKLMRDQLESMGKKDCKKTILSYIKERKIAKKRGDEVRRRFGDRRTIHPEDYPKLTEVLEELEADDFSVIEYLR